MPSTLPIWRQRARTTLRHLRYALIYAWGGWGDRTTFNVGFWPVRPEIGRDPLLAPEGEHFEVYAVLADLIEARRRPPAGPPCEDGPPSGTPGGTGIPAGSDRLIEIGCGRGGGLGYLRGRFGGEVVGIDVAAAAVRHARARGLDVRHASATGLPFPDASFDAAVAVETLLRFGEAERSLMELRRVLKPGGVLAVADFRPFPFVDARNHLTALARRTGFAILHLEDRTEAARQSVALTEPKRLAVADAMPWPVRRIMADTFALAGSRRHRGWVAGERSYAVALLGNGPHDPPATPARRSIRASGAAPAGDAPGNAHPARGFGPGPRDGPPP